MKNNFVSRYMFVLGSIFFFIVSQSMNAQSCRDYYKKCNDPGKGYQMSSMSRSFSLKKYKKVNITYTFLGEREYYISVGGKPKLKSIQFRIINSSDNSIIYDNSADNFKTDKSIQVDQSVILKFEISAPQMYEDESYCAGLLIAFKDIDSSK